MAWRITGTYYAPCSCNVGCPCTLGELEADRGWCSGTLVFDIQGGNVDGTNVGGTKVAVVGDWPSGFLAGNGTSRLYKVCAARNPHSIARIILKEENHCQQKRTRPSSGVMSKRLAMRGIWT